MKRLVILITLISFLFSVQVGFAAPLTSTLKDQQDVAVTIYNSNVGLVKDTRLIYFKPGIHELREGAYRIGTENPEFSLGGIRASD